MSTDVEATRYANTLRNPVSLSREIREMAADHRRKAAAYDRLLAWLDSLESVGVAGRFIAPREVRAVILEDECKSKNGRI